MINYNAKDKEIKIPNGIGNLNLTINSGGGGDTPDLSNYATTQYVDEEILKVNSELENIGEDIDVLEGRIIDLENNGGGSSGGGKESVVIDLGVTTEPNLTKEQIIEIADNFLSKKYTIKYVDTDDANTDYQLRLIDIIAVNDTRGGKEGFSKYVELVGVTINVNIELLKWCYKEAVFNSPESITLQKESMATIIWEYLVPLMSNVSNLETKATDIENRAFNNVDSLENQIKENTDRLDTLENNGGTGGGGSSVVRIVAENEILSVEDFDRIFDNPNNEVFELQFKYSNNDNYIIFTNLTKEKNSSFGFESITFFDFMQRYKFLKYFYDKTTIYMESSPIDSNTE